jgi:hypothetical protein
LVVIDLFVEPVFSGAETAGGGRQVAGSWGAGSGEPFRELVTQRAQDREDDSNSETQ